MSQTVGNGEHLTLEVLQHNPINGEQDYSSHEEMQLEASKAQAFIDLRLKEMNVRMLEAYDLLNPKYFEPHSLYRFLSILDVIAGKVSAFTIRKRWDDETEENFELEQGRLNQNGVGSYAEIEE